MISVVSDPTPEEFLKHAGPLLYENEAQNGLLLGICESLIAGLFSNPPNENPRFLRLIDGNATVAAAMQMPPVNNLILSGADGKSIETLTQYLGENAIDVPGVVGPVREVDLFAKFWMTLKSKKISATFHHLIYTLTTVTPPANIPGKMHQATEADLDLVAQWIFAFAVEIMPANEIQNAVHWRNFAAKAITNQFAHLWILNSEPVAMSFVSRPTKTGIAINYVYTPKEHRKKGYASALVAALSQKMLDSGKKFCVLYTDAENPTSNKIYQNIGYREAATSKLYLF